MSNLLEFFIGLRYTRAKRDNHFISFISLSSIIGIALGVLVLIVVLSVMNGFEQSMRERILSMVPHVTVIPHDNGMDNWERVADGFDVYPHVEAVAPYIQRQIMLSKGDVARGVNLFGVIPDLEKSISQVSEEMTQGSMSDLQAGEYGIVLGETLAKDLDVGLNDKIMLLNPKPSNDPIHTGLPELRSFTVMGTFKVDMQQYDTTYAYVHMTDAADMLQMGETVTGLRIKLDDLYQARQVAELIAEASNYTYWVLDWTRENSNLFKAIKMQKTVMFLILVMIVAVAVFNLVSTLVMVVTDKESDIAILRTLGFTPIRVMKVFMVQGTIVGVMGTVIGVVLGVLLAINIETIIPLLEEQLDHNFISPEVYGISTVEAEVSYSEVILIAGTALFLSMIATLYPAWKASRVQPAEALRHE